MTEPSLESVRLALDVGGTKMAAGVVRSDAQVVDYAVVPTPRDADAETLYDTATFVLNAVLVGVAAPVSSLGVGCGGPMAWPSGVVSPLNLPGWRDFPLRDRLAQDFDVPVRLHNDAVCLTIGEHLLGAGRGSRNVMGVIVGTGVGAGVIVDGRLLGGATGNAGHLGHLVIDAAGPPCRCGGRGCLEAIARGPALVDWAEHHGWQPVGAADAVELADAARRGDRVAAEAFRRAGGALGQAIAGAAALLDVSEVAIGGGVASAADLLLPALYESFRRHAGLGFAQRCRIVLAATDAGLVGAAALSDDRYWSVPQAGPPPAGAPAGRAAAESARPAAGTAVPPPR